MLLKEGHEVIREGGQTQVEASSSTTSSSTSSLVIKQADLAALYNQAADAYVKASSASKRKDFAEAIKINMQAITFLKAIQDNGTYHPSEIRKNLAASYNNLASDQINLRQYEAAQKSYEKALQFEKELTKEGPELVKYIKNNMAALQQKIKNNKLDALFQKGIDSFTRGEGAFKLEAYKEAKRHFNSAIEYFTKVLADNENYPKVKRYLAISYNELARSYVGLYDFGTADLLFPMALKYINGLSRDYSEIRIKIEANMKKSQSLQEERVQLYISQAINKLDEGKSKYAKKMFYNAINIYSQALHDLIGISKRYKHHPDINASLSCAYFYLAIAYRMTNQVNKAYDNITAAIDCYKHNPSLFLERSYCLALMGDRNLQAALEDCDTAYQMAISSQQPYMDLSLIEKQRDSLQIKLGLTASTKEPLATTSSTTISTTMCSSTPPVERRLSFSFGLDSASFSISSSKNSASSTSLSNASFSSMSSSSQPAQVFPDLGDLLKNVQRGTSADNWEASSPAKGGVKRKRELTPFTIAPDDYVVLTTCKAGKTTAGKTIGYGN
jgi:tetratricopeptide (TPR) repeat protein